VNLTITNRLATHQSSKLAKITSFDDLTSLRNYEKIPESSYWQLYSGILDCF
jgi:predicted GIY-YIG superfamily endonuclease